MRGVEVTRAIQIRSFPRKRKSSRLGPRFRGDERTDKDSPKIKFLEEVIAFVVDHDEGREIFPLDPPDRLHAELGIFHDLAFLDAMLGEVRRRAADGGEIETA